MIIKYATTEDIAAIAAVEAECFPPAEAATAKEFVDRVKYYGNHFWLMYKAEKLIAFVDGFVTDERDLTDVMYEDATLHNENGAWQMIFGVNTIPAYRKQGGRAIEDARLQWRTRVWCLPARKGWCCIMRSLALLMKACPKNLRMAMLSGTR